MTQDMKIDTILHTIGQQVVPLKRTGSPLGAHWESAWSALRTMLLTQGDCPLVRMMRYAAVLILMMVGVGEMWGQPEPIGYNYSGTYFIANANYSDDKNLTGSDYSSTNKTNNSYLCPASNYYDGDINDDLKKMPFLTTHKPDNVGTGRPSILTDPIAKWEIVFAESDEESQKDYYYIKFVSSESTKYYLVHNEQIVSGTGTNVGRVRYHLQLSIDDVDKDDYLFYISPNTRNTDKNYNICSKAEESRTPGTSTRPAGASLNPAKANMNFYSGQNQSSPGKFKRSGKDANDVYCGGLIGHWDLHDKTGLWYFEDVKCKRPVITYSSETGEVTITSTEGATIYYTIDGITTPDPANAGEEYPTKEYDPTDKPTISDPTTFKAIAVKDWMDDSEVATHSIVKLPDPNVSFDDVTQKVSITSSVEGATNVYTTDGTNPTTSSTEYSEAISLTETTTVKAMTMKDGYFNSDVVQLTVTQLESSPSISKEGSIVTLSCSDPDATIYYTTNGTTPTQDPLLLYSEPFSLNGNQKFTIKAIAAKTGYLNSVVAEQVVDNRSSIPAPTITYTDNVVTITANDYGDEIYYTIDGTSPTTSTDTHFTTSGSFNLVYGGNYTITAIASNGVINSSEATETINLTNCGYSGIYYIHSTENGGEYCMYPVGGQSALVTTAKKTDEDAIWKIQIVGEYYHIIHYKDGKYLVAADLVDGSMPETETVSLVATDSPGENALFEITRKSGNESDILQQIILIRPKAATDATTTTTTAGGHKKYLNKRDGNLKPAKIGLWDNTGSSQWTLVTVPAKPTFTVNDINVTISSDLGNVYYTIDGTTPTSSSTLGKNVSLEYGPSYTIKAISIYHDNISGTDWTSGVATSDPIQVNLLNPIITRSGNDVTITNSQVSGVTFRYTFSDNGTDPEDPVPPVGAGTDYTSALSITANARNVFKAIAYNTVDGTTYTSSVVTFVVDLRSATPISSLAGITSATGSYILASGFTAEGTPSESGVEIGTSANPFRGTIDGDLVEFELGSSPLFDYVQDAIIKNLNITSVSISTSGDAGAIANVAQGETRIYNCGIKGGTVGGDGNVGGLVGTLKGSARVINCFSYADITSGSFVGGIVGKNEFRTTANNLKTMVMNCMFYGEIDNDYCTSIAPIYNGEIITNDGDADGVNNFNYFWAGASYVQGQHIDVYNCALSAETRFLQRFEFFRHLLNSNRELAAWWATGSCDNKDEMMKWVLEPSQKGTSTPYPILKTPGKYPSVVNLVKDNLNEFSTDEEIKKTQRNQGRKFGTLTVKIQMDDAEDESVPYHHPGTGVDEASITTPSLPLPITDKDPDHFNFNYYKVQLPYYNDVGTKNYTGNRVVTGWKIVEISEEGSNSFSKDNDDVAATPPDVTASVTDGVISYTNTPYNFADRNCTDKDLYSVSGRVFNQGAYFDVPEGVSAITIEPYWGKAVYLSDAYWDVVYQDGTGTGTGAGTAYDAMTTPVNVTTVGGGQHYNNGVSDFNGQLVYTSLTGDNGAISSSALFSGTNVSNPTVYDYAVVLVGNYHHTGDIEANKTYTVTSVDLDGDNEPDYSFMLRFNGRLRFHPVRYDFLNLIGLGMAQKTTGGKGTYNFGIMQPNGWFECTNTALFRVTQFEYDLSPRTMSPIILQGGVIEQWVTHQNGSAANAVEYYHVGGNVWFKEFHIGVHQDEIGDQFVSPHPPISVTGGDFDEFYLTGLYNTPNANYNDNAECYINGGRFGKVAGTGMQGIGGFTMNGTTKESYSNGNIIWQIDNADIDEFYAGGINAAHIAEGNIYTVITNSRVDQFCGGPKFGDMNSTTKVVTNADNCTFRTFFGAGYGGNSYNRRYPANQNNKININWNSWVQGDNGLKYRVNPTFKVTINKVEVDILYTGVETRIDYQFLPMSSNTENVCRLFVDYVTFSLAKTYDVTSKLTDCTITTSPLGGRLDLFDQCLGNFYGGGSLGKVVGNVKSTLTNCTVEGNVFGAGYSASLPPVQVMNNSFQTQPHYDENLGAYLEAELPATTTYHWEHADELGIDTGDSKRLFTTEDLSKSSLGSINGDVTLTITTTGTKQSKIGTDGNSDTGHVYGGGQESYVTGETKTVTVNILGNTEVLGDVFGGGDEGDVEGKTVVNIGEEPTP